MIFSICCLAASAAKPKQMVQDGIFMDVRDSKSIVRSHQNSKYLKRSIVDLKPIEMKSTIVDDLEVPMAATMLENDPPPICADVVSEHTGFDVNDENGFLKHASCDDLEASCQDTDIGEQVRLSCEVTCALCVPDTSGQQNSWNGPCFDSKNTGIRFREGPKADCADLINYCNHTDIGAEVTKSCKLSCGLCELHVEGPWSDDTGACTDLQAHEEPQFTISTQLAGCSDIAIFCQSHPDSYLVRHKCPLTCGVCNNDPHTTTIPMSRDTGIPGDAGGCNRRRRWGFCSSRRRRNI